MKSNLHKIKRNWQSILIYFKRKFDPKYNQSPGQFDLKLYQICMSMMEHPDTKFVASHLLHGRYLVNETEQIIIIIQENEISITNHQYRYSLTVYGKYMLGIKSEFDKKMLNTSRQLESMVFDNIRVSLNTIANQLKKYA